MSKIIKMHVDVATTKSGGGTPVLKVPLNFDKLNELKSYFQSIDIYQGQEVFKLNHKVFIDSEGLESTIPAPSNRFLKGMKNIFGDNTFVPLQTYYNKTTERLDFLYFVSYAQVLTAIQRIDAMIGLYNQLMEEFEVNIPSCFNEIQDDKKTIATRLINNYKKENQIKVLSLSGMLDLFSGQYSLLEKFEMVSQVVQGDSSDETEVRFVSRESLTKAEETLNERRVQILHKGLDTLTFKGSFNGKLNGTVAYKKGVPVLASLGNETVIRTLEDIMFTRYELTDSEKNSVAVGVIDGGMPTDSIVKRQLSSYSTSRDLDVIESRPAGNHAEEVCSLLLWGQKLSEKTNDNLTSPNVSLFDVISEADTIATFKHKVQKIIAENSHAIKLWNISISFPGEKTDDILSQVGVFLDQLQTTYDVLIFIPSGNKTATDAGEGINAPSGSHRGISVSSVKSNNLSASYSKEGYGKYLNQKPDIAIFGGDDGDEIKVISGNKIANSSGGTSFATPMAVRKGAELISQGFQIIDIPSILNAYATWYSIHNSIPINNKNGNGVLPVDSTEMMNMIRTKSIVVVNSMLSGDYRQAFVDVKLPKSEGKYDVNVVASINVDGKLADYATYEYVLDSSSFSFGRVDPFTNKAENVLAPVISHGRGDGTSESALRIYKGKFKTRLTKKSFPSRPRKATKSNRTINQTRDILNWGLKFERNLIGSTRATADNQEISVCLIFSSKNMRFHDEFISLNRTYITNYNDLIIENENTTIVENEYITFE